MMVDALPAWLADRSVIATAIAFFGTALLTLAVVAVVRMPDAFMKLHASSKAVASGAVTVLVGVAIAGGAGFAVRAFLIALFFIVTAPVAAYAVARLEACRDRATSAPAPRREGEERASRRLPDPPRTGAD